MITDGPPWHTFQYPPVTRKFLLLGSVVSLVTIWVVLQVSSSHWRDDILVFACIVCLALYANLNTHLTEVRIDDNGITQRSLCGRRTLKWTDVEEFVSFSRLLLLRGSRHKPEIRLFRGDFGFSIEPFEDLRERILARVREQVWAKWRSKNARIEHSYAYPPISTLQCVGYLVAVGLIVVFFVAAPLTRGVFGMEQALYLLFSMAVVGVLFLRDLRKTRRQVVVGANGLRESDGEGILFRWQKISALQIREPILGCGSMVVRDTENRALTIPVRMKGAGELFFLITTRGNPTITYGHDV